MSPEPRSPLFVESVRISHMNTMEFDYFLPVYEILKNKDKILKNIKKLL